MAPHFGLFINQFTLFYSFVGLKGFEKGFWVKVWQFPCILSTCESIFWPWLTYLDLGAYQTRRWVNVSVGLYVNHLARENDYLKIIPTETQLSSKVLYFKWDGGGVYSLCGNSSAIIQTNAQLERTLHQPYMTIWWTELTRKRASFI